MAGDGGIRRGAPRDTRGGGGRRLATHAGTEGGPGKKNILKFTLPTWNFHIPTFGGQTEFEKTQK